MRKIKVTLVSAAVIFEYCSSRRPIAVIGRGWVISQVLAVDPVRLDATGGTRRPSFVRGNFRLFPGGYK